MTKKRETVTKGDYERASNIAGQEQVAATKAGKRWLARRAGRVKRQYARTARRMKD